MKEKLLALLTLLLFSVGAANAWTDFALDFTKDTQYAFSGLSSSTTLYITSNGTVSAASAAGDLGTITGQFHNAAYGL